MALGGCRRDRSEVVGEWRGGRSRHSTVWYVYWYRIINSTSSTTSHGLWHSFRFCTLRQHPSPFAFFLLDCMSEALRRRLSQLPPTRRSSRFGGGSAQLESRSRRPACLSPRQQREQQLENCPLATQSSASSSATSRSRRCNTCAPQRRRRGGKPRSSTSTSGWARRRRTRPISLHSTCSSPLYSLLCFLLCCSTRGLNYSSAVVVHRGSERPTSNVAKA